MLQVRYRNEEDILIFLIPPYSDLQRNILYLGAHAFSVYVQCKMQVTTSEISYIQAFAGRPGRGSSCLFPKYWRPLIILLGACKHKTFKARRIYQKAVTEEKTKAVQPKKSNFAHLDAGSILQINATIIAGLLILVSISGSVLPSSTFEVSPPTSTNQTAIQLYEADKAFSQAGQAVDIWGKWEIAFSAMTPFVFSSILALLSNGKSASICIMIAGFIWLLIFFGIIVFTNQNHALNQLNQAIEKYNQIKH